MNFIDSLNEMKRRSQLANQPFTPQEIMGMSSGFFDAAANNSGKVREQRLAEERLAAEKEFTNNQLDAAKKAEATQMYQNVGNTAVTGLGMDYMSSKPGESLIAKGADYAIDGASKVFGDMVPDMGGQVLAEGATAAVPTAASDIGTIGAGVGDYAGALGDTISSTVGTVALPYMAAKGAGMAINAISDNNPDMKETPIGRLGRSLKHPITGVEKEWADMLSERGIGSKDLNRVVAGVLNPVGGIFEAIGGGCIIVTACTDRNSPEVEIARKFRNKYLSYAQLRGYYLLADKIVPILERNETVRINVKKWLVDRLIEYGKYRLGIYAKASLSSIIVSKIFLATIKTIGVFVHRYVRLNGEVY